MAKKKNKGPGRPESQDPKILFPSFRVRKSEIEALKLKAKKSGKSLSKYASGVMSDQSRAIEIVMTTDL